MARIAILSWSSGQFDARTLRVARSSREAGHEVVIYARWEPGLAREEIVDGFRLIRATTSLSVLVPGGRGRRRQTERNLELRSPTSTEATPPTQLDHPTDRLPPGLRTIARALNRRVSQLKVFPLRPMAWARALDDVVAPADLWHGMWGGSLPAALRFRKRFGGAAVYDARDILLQSRGFARLSRPVRAVLGWLERRWAQRMDAVLTVNEPYAEILAQRLRIGRPAVVMNCPARWQPPEPRPDRIRERLGLPATTPVVLYQGLLLTDRGIEQSMAAILEVPGAALVLLGFGVERDRLAAEIAGPPYAGRVFLLDAVPPDELIEWTASADVSVMAIQPTSLNHRFTTPQKLFESLAAGTPVVASDLPGMAPIVTATGAGVLCDPTEPASIAAAIRSILDLGRDDRAALRGRALGAAHATYNWETQERTLRVVHDRLLARGASGDAPPGRP